MTVNLSELTGRSVLDVSTARTVGQVRSGVLDPTQGSILALRLAKTAGDAEILPWEAIKAIGPDAITIDSVEALRHPVGRAEQRGVSHAVDPIGARVLSDRGEALGEVAELSVDETTGEVEEVVLGDGARPGSTLVGIGGYALILGTERS